MFGLVAADCLDAWTSSIVGGCWLPGALLGAMWTTSLEAGAAVSCWRLQVVLVAVSLRRLVTVVECCIDGDGFSMRRMVTALDVALNGDGFGCCVGWRRLLWHRMVTPIACVGW